MISNSSKFGWQFDIYLPFRGMKEGRTGRSSFSTVESKAPCGPVIVSMRANQSQIEPMQKMAATLLKHEPLLLNWFESQGLSSGVVEGFNNKAKLTMRKAYGFTEFETIATALYHQLGNLPEPKTTHKFC